MRPAFEIVQQNYLPTFFRQRRQRREQLTSDIQSFDCDISSFDRTHRCFLDQGFRPPHTLTPEVIPRLAADDLSQPRSKPIGVATTVDLRYRVHERILTDILGILDFTSYGKSYRSRTPQVSFGKLAGRSPTPFADGGYQVCVSLDGVAHRTRNLRDGKC